MQALRRREWLSYSLDLKWYFALNPSKLGALRLSGRSNNPGEVALVDALDREHHDGWGIVWVRRPDAGPNRFGERGPRLHDHDGFLGALDRVLPAIDRDHARQDVDAGGEPGANERVAGLLCLDFFPEGFMGNTGSCSKALPSGFQNRLQAWRVAHEQALQLLSAGEVVVGNTIGSRGIAAKKQGATAAYAAFYTDSTAHCTNVESNSSGVSSATYPLVVNFVIQFKDEASASKGYTTESIFGFSTSSLKSGGAPVVEGTKTGLTPNSIVLTVAVSNQSFYIAVWQNKVFMVILAILNIDTATCKNVALAENSRIK